MKSIAFIILCLSVVACGNGGNDKAEQDSTRIEMHADSTRGFPNSNDTTPLSVDTMARRDTAQPNSR
ncbi:hypothetical protein [Parasegetibacter sp. NRK P23]|uniref:hypothetical protein n=1 Tax=Parasegetibacter sp. NRK P23 TaxID=2942999 RepID=UPI002043B0E5|nr:hypothetical protein [Parasegetibacter sp. NRK P23]MCM5529322.1 hypothetical protein [Parasegetibacter sp. NRK P23]